MPSDIVVDALAYALASRFTSIILRAFLSHPNVNEQRLLQYIYDQLKGLQRSGICFEEEDRSKEEDRGIRLYSGTNISVSTVLAHGKIFVSLGLFHPILGKTVLIEREIGDIVFIVRARGSESYAFIQVKHARRDLSKDTGEALIASKGRRATNKGQLLIYSGFVEYISPYKNASLFRLQSSLSARPYHFYLFSVRRKGEDMVILKPSSEILFRLMIGCIRYAHGPSPPYNVCGSSKMVSLVSPKYRSLQSLYSRSCFKIRRICVTDEFFRDLSKIVGRNHRLYSNSDEGTKLFDGKSLNNAIGNISNPRELMRAILFNIIRSVLVVRSRELKDKVVYNVGRKKGITELGTALSRILDDAFKTSKISESGHRSSIILLMDPPIKPLKLKEKKIYEIRDLHEEDPMAENFDVETNGVDKTLIILIKLGGEEE